MKNSKWLILPCILETPWATHVDTLGSQAHKQSQNFPFGFFLQFCPKSEVSIFALKVTILLPSGVEGVTSTNVNSPSPKVNGWLSLGKRREQGIQWTPSQDGDLKISFFPDAGMDTKIGEQKHTKQKKHCPNKTVSIATTWGNSFCVLQAKKFIRMTQVDTAQKIVMVTLGIFLLLHILNFFKLQVTCLCFPQEAIIPKVDNILWLQKGIVKGTMITPPSGVQNTLNWFLVSGSSFSSNPHRKLGQTFEMDAQVLANECGCRW